MKHTPTKIRESLIRNIDALRENPELHIRNPEKDFSRTRKLPFEKTISALLAFERKSLQNELLSFSNCSVDTPTSSAFVQQRNKILPKALEDLFHAFTNDTDPGKKYRGYRLLTIDGSKIPVLNADNDELFQHHYPDNCRPYHLTHMNALYDLVNHTYVDALINKGNEHSAFTGMVDRSAINAPVIVIADRGYESYNNIAHAEEKGWKYIIRIRTTIGCGLFRNFGLPADQEFDKDISVTLCRKQTKELMYLYKTDPGYRFIPSSVRFDYLPVTSKKNDPLATYELSYRIVYFHVMDDIYEAVITNLDRSDFSVKDLKAIYEMRWGVETSFRDLKYTIGLLSLHSKRADFILQEIFARLIMYNFAELITSHVVIRNKSRKYSYKVNFSVAAHICREFLLNKIRPPDAEALIARFIVPIRPDRKRPRNLNTVGAVSFIYRVA